MKTNSIHNSAATAQPSTVRDVFTLCRKAVAQIEKAKKKILADFRGRLEEHAHLLRLAVNEAEALAWQTDYPHLLFPTLAVEKAQAAAKWHTRQEYLRKANRRQSWAL
jgi:hypothetical protein